MLLFVLILAFFSFVSGLFMLCLLFSWMPSSLFLFFIHLTLKIVVNDLLMSAFTLSYVLIYSDLLLIILSIL